MAKDEMSADIELEPVETVVEEVVPPQEAIPSSLMFEEAVDLATRLAPDGHLPEELYEGLLAAIPPEMHVEFSLALASRGIIVVPPLAPPDAEGLREARRIVMGRVEDAGHLDEATYRDLLARFGPGTGIYLNQWIVSQGIPVSADYRKDLRRRITRKPRVKRFPLERQKKLSIEKER